MLVDVDETRISETIFPRALRAERMWRTAKLEGKHIEGKYMNPIKTILAECKVQSAQKERLTGVDILIRAALKKVKESVCSTVHVNL